MSSCDINQKAPRYYYLNFIGNRGDITDNELFKNFDTNYINLDILPFSFFPIYNQIFYDKYMTAIETNINPEVASEITDIHRNDIKNVKTEFNTLYKSMKNNKLIYNRYLIYPITIIIVIIWILLILFILKYIHYTYNIFYIYFISTIVIILLIFGSLWFLYVNSQLL